MPARSRTPQAGDSLWNRSPPSGETIDGRRLGCGRSPPPSREGGERAGPLQSGRASGATARRVRRSGSSSTRGELGLLSGGSSDVLVTRGVRTDSGGVRARPRAIVCACRAAKAVRCLARAVRPVVPLRGRRARFAEEAVGVRAVRGRAHGRMDCRRRRTASSARWSRPPKGGSETKAKPRQVPSNGRATGSAHRPSRAISVATDGASTKRSPAQAGMRDASTREGALCRLTWRALGGERNRVGARSRKAQHLGLAPRAVRPRRQRAPQAAAAARRVDEYSTGERRGRPKCGLAVK